MDIVSSFRTSRPKIKLKLSAVQAEGKCGKENSEIHHRGPRLSRGSSSMGALEEIYQT